MRITWIIVVVVVVVVMVGVVEHKESACCLGLSACFVAALLSLSCSVFLFNLSFLYITFNNSVHMVTTLLLDTLRDADLEQVIDDQDGHSI